MAKHLHLDLVGGLSGDMFIGAMLDAFPVLWPNLERVLEQGGFPDVVEISHSAHNDGVLTGTAFKVSAGESGHHHRHYADIRRILSESSLEAATRDTALSIFHEIAVVEAGIHGKSVDDIAFHEVGAWDSIGDIVLSAYLIQASGAETFSVSAVPTGSGFVETAHGRLPVPVPATSRLLEGFELFDDGLKGERVTPTGAAILKYLAPTRRVPPGATLLGDGFGFGTKKFPGISNVARVLVYETESVSTSQQPWESDQIIRLSFDVDDQSPESLAAAVTELLAEAGVRDVSQQSFHGKKGRQGTMVTLLVSPGAEEAVMARCFDLTTTLGIRKEQIDRVVLRREEVEVYVGERSYRVKVAFRPSGPTAKIEADDLASAGLSPADERQVRMKAEALALEQIS